MNLNKAMIIGNLTRDPELRQTQTGKAVAGFSIATNFVWNDAAGQKQEKVEYHNIVAWGKLADICGKYLKKGAKIYLEGRLQTREWLAKDNTKRYTTEIVAENMIMLDRAGQTGGGNYGGGNNYQAGNSYQQPSNNNYNQPAVEPEPIINYDQPDAPSTGGPDEEEIRVENIPF